MKYLFFLITIVTAALACNDIDQSKQSSATASTGSSSKADTAPLTSIQWIDSVKNFGTITEGQQLTVSFRFKNTGSKPLIIRSVQPGCGCTVADPPKEPIAPGAEGVINGSFNSSNRLGSNHKEIFVEANTTGTQRHTLTFQVEVAKKAE